ncbi:unnamed protein product [Chrysodeixis includens]|uniref:NADH dehydrogenase [ubiquinone] 1 alpha subcomplex subunit 7 n=1 Tax=Chrysodeixis includens TaxID=689277 RepID=A0A9P0C168_CHRIL|nr:unnamed protein product [Chrysodeixis includens]
MAKRVKFEFRDVSTGFQKIREFLLGRKYIQHQRYQPTVAPRSIPPPDIPRGPEVKYANHYYARRNVFNSVRPPVVAPFGEGKPKGRPRDPCAKKPGALSFSCPPTPGPPWWFDGHCYYEYIETAASNQSGCPPDDPCAQPPKRKCPPPCPKKDDNKKYTPPPKPCDPCKPPPPQEGCK